MKYALLLTLAASLSFGLVDNSFRYQSTAMMFEDDYDLIFDPARICQIDGARLWTSLSNFVTSDENLFSDNAVPYILVGGTKPFGKVYPALVYDRSSDKYAMPTGLYSPMGYEMYGDAELTEINWNDLDNNGEYDQRTVETVTRSAFDAINENDIYFGVGYKMDNIRLGLGVDHYAYDATTTSPVYNYTYDYIEENIDPSLVTFQQTAQSSGDMKDTYGYNEFVLSGWKDSENMSLGLAFYYGMGSMNNSRKVTGDSALFTDPSDPTTFYTTVDWYDTLDAPRSGNNMDAEFKVFYDYNENAQGRFYLHLGMGSWSYGDNAQGLFYSTREDIYNDFTWNTLTDYAYYDGSYSEKGWGIGTKQLFNLTERLKFGFGFEFDNDNYSDSTTVLDTIVEVTTYDDNDGIVVDPDDYVATTWSSETWMTRRTGSSMTINLPVGLEFNIANPVVLRLGAMHTWFVDDYTTVHNLIQYEPQRTRTVDGTGAVTETLDDPGSQPVGSEETITEKDPRTHYYYGIGWKVSDNLQIDFMGFENLTELTDWRLSATLRF
jgi:hypothetical protein